jgi:hypothetical protein
MNNAAKMPTTTREAPKASLLHVRHEPPLKDYVPTFHIGFVLTLHLGIRLISQQLPHENEADDLASRMGKALPHWS